MLSPRLPMTPQTGQWILSGSCPCSRAVATAWVSCPGFHVSTSLTADSSHPATITVTDGTDAWSLPARRLEAQARRRGVKGPSPPAIGGRGPFTPTEGGPADAGVKGGASGALGQADVLPADQSDEPAIRGGDRRALQVA